MNQSDSFESDIKMFEPLWGVWHVEDQIGEGSTGKVYRILRQERKIKLYSALKHLVIPNALQLKEAIDAMGQNQDDLGAYFEELLNHVVDEIRLMYQLSGSGHIVQYQDHLILKRQIEGEYPQWNIFIRMECLKPLSLHMSHCKMTVSDMLGMAIGVLKALEFCNRQGIIHRDVKEENIFIDEWHQYKLGDFGISKDIFAETRGQGVSGSPAYMAPEILKGEPYNGTQDTYALAMILYKLLNYGRLPHYPDYPQKITLRAKKEAYKLRQEGAPLPLPFNVQNALLTHAIMKALSYRPDERFSSPFLFRQSLEAVKNNMTYQQLQIVLEGV